MNKKCSFNKKENNHSRTPARSIRMFDFANIVQKVFFWLCWTNSFPNKLPAQFGAFSCNVGTTKNSGLLKTEEYKANYVKVFNKKETMKNDLIKLKQNEENVEEFSRGRNCSANYFVLTPFFCSQIYVFGETLRTYNEHLFNRLKIWLLCYKFPVQQFLFFLYIKISECQRSISITNICMR